jgi:catechol 2,3-dioxygenase-like lactoylglutathione lyase family enzyme
VSLKDEERRVPTIVRLQHVALTVPITRLEEARAFYSETLGLQETPRPPENADRPGIWYTLGSTELHIQARDSVPAENGDRHPALVVDDIDGWRWEFARLGVDVINQPTLFGRRRFNIRDPFGNLIELMTEGGA